MLALWQILVLTVVVLFLIIDYRKKNCAQVPSFTAWPLVGTLPAIWPYRKDTTGLQLRAYKELGENYRFWGLGFLNPQNIIFTHKPENVKYFLNTNFSNYERKSNVWRFDKLFGHGIFNSNGDNWKFHRRTARPLFTKQSVAEMLPAFVEHGHKLLAHLGRAADNSEKSIDFQDLLHRFTMDSICTIGFGISLNSLDQNVPFADAFNRSQETIGMNGRVPYLRFLPDKQFDKDYETMAEFIINIVRSRREKNDYEGRTDLLSRFMSMKDDSGKPFSEEYLRDMVLNFFIAGRDTTACLLTWTFYLLAKNPDVQKKLVDTIAREIGDEEPTVESLNRKEMDYLRHVLDETLRLYPSVPFDFRRAVARDVLPDGTVIEPGTGLGYSAFVLGHSEKYWKDAERFMPERWENKDALNNDAFVAFHAGPQTCLGRPMAYLEAKCAVVLILQKFRILLDDTHEVRPKPFLVMPVRDGLWTFVKRREAEELN